MLPDEHEATGSSTTRGLVDHHWLAQAWPVPQAASLACLLEASSPKAGNVYPQADFADMTYVDFLLSASAIPPVFQYAATRSVGELVLSGVAATQARSTVNTNLGTLLLLAPLARAAAKLANAVTDTQSKVVLTERITSGALHEAVSEVLTELTASDATQVYEAIRLAKPGGLGQSSEHDIHAAPPESLVAAMQLAAEVDAVARQYVNGFYDVFETLLPWLTQLLTQSSDPRHAITALQLKWLASEPDGLIVRKSGRETATRVQELATLAEQESYDGSRRGASWQELDAFLRADGHRRNPGTTADLIAATLFVLLVTP